MAGESISWRTYLAARLAADLPPAADDVIPILQNGSEVKKIRWADMKAELGVGRNLLIGGNFSTNPFQRGTASLAVTVSGTYIADRWRLEFDGAPTVTRDIVNVAVGSKVLGITVRKAIKITITNKAAATYIRLGQRIESVDTLANDTGVLSSAIQGSTALTVPIRVVQCFGTGGAPSANVVTAGDPLAVTANLAELYADVTVPAIAGKTYGTTANTDYLELQYDLSNLATGDYVIIPLSQLERSAWPSLHERLPVGAVIALCQRYCERAGACEWKGYNSSTFWLSAGYKVEKRAVPSLALTATTISAAVAEQGTVTVTDCSINSQTSSVSGFYAQFAGTVSVGSIVAGNVGAANGLPVLADAEL